MTVVLWVILLDDGWGYGHVFATYGWRLWGVCNTPLHVLHAIHRNMVIFSGRDTRYPSKYERVFRTRYTLPVEIRKRFSNRIRVTHRNTNVFFEPGTRYALKYEHVFQTRYTLSIEIRKRFPNWAQTIHRNTDVFSESGEGVDEPEDGEEDDGGAYDAVQYADAANVEPSAEA